MLEFGEKYNPIMINRKEEERSDQLEGKKEDIKQDYDDEYYEERKITYDRLATIEEIKTMSEDICKQIKNKAQEIGISEEEVEELAGIEMESFEGDRLSDLELNMGELEFIKDNLEKSINEIWKSETSGKTFVNFIATRSESEGWKGRSVGGKLVSPIISQSEKIMDFVGEHKKTFAFLEFFATISTYTISSIKCMAANNAEVEVDGNTISLADLANNTSLIENIKQDGCMGLPATVLQEFYSHEMFESKNNSAVFNFDTFSGENGEQKIRFGNITAPRKDFERLDKNLQEKGFSVFDSACSWDDFMAHKDEISSIIAEDLHVSQQDVREYIDKYERECNYPKPANLSIVELKDFKAYQGPEFGYNVERGKRDAYSQYKEVYQKYKVYDEMGHISEKHQAEADAELDLWAVKNGYANFNQAISRQKMVDSEKKPLTKLQQLGYDEAWVESLPNDDKFRDLFWQAVQQKYADGELSNMTPNQLFVVIAETIGENVEYNDNEGRYRNFMASLDPNGALHKLFAHAAEIAGKPSANPNDNSPAYTAFESGEGVCADYSIAYVAAFAAMKDKLKELNEGKATALDNVECILVTSSAQNHMYPALYSLSKDGHPVCTFLEPTDYKSGDDLNAVDEYHYFAAIDDNGSEKDASLRNQTIVEKAVEWNNLVVQENLRQLLFTYDNKTYKREKRVGLSEEAYKEMRNERR